MALPPPAPAALSVITNPIEGFIAGFNTNTYFIGIMMILLNLGGRHFPSALTPEQDRVFQLQWVRRIFLFVIIFVATRNVFTAFWLCLALILVLGYLTNETSSLYLFGEAKPVATAPTPPPSDLSPEEQDIFKKLTEKSAKLAAQKKAPEAQEDPNLYVNTYMNSMRYIQSNI
jgi:hypothetical protein